MGNGHDYVALEWVRGEIDETLNQARQALEAFADNREDIAQIRFCLNYIHQVHGTLQMVEFYGAALLAEEMEKLADKLIHKRIERTTDAISVLMQAILKLPDYLEHLTAGRKDVPVLLLPILNDLRACRGETLLSDSSLFTPNLTPVRYKAPESARHRLQDPKMVEHLKKLRTMYRGALLGIKKNEKTEENLHYLHKVALRMEKLCQHTPHEEFWGVVAALMEMLAAQEVEVSSAIKKLVIDIEHVLKELYDERHEALVLPVNEDVLKNVLFYIAKNVSHLAHANRVKQRFNLGQALSTQEEIDAERSQAMGPGKDTISSVTSVIADELARIKDQLDLYVRSEYRDVSDLEEVLPGLHQISNTITILGLTTPRQVIEDQIAVIKQHVDDGESPDDATIMDIAGALLYVEGTLAGLSEEKKRARSASSMDQAEDEISRIAPGQVEAANDAVLREIRNGLEQAKNCIVGFSASGWEKSEIAEAPGILSTVKGGLQIISLTQAAALVDACNRFVQKALLGSDLPPNMKQLETLADAITSIEYYLERLSAGSRDNDLILQVAEESVTELGFPVGAEETYQMAEAVAEPAEEIPVVLPAAEKERDEDLIDDEIIEIFIEEAQEVLQSMDDYFPAYRDAPDDQRALADLRRAFHTLKGSGRLVGATTVGELAWSIENMLNRVIDNTITHSDAMFGLMAKVIRFLPQVINAFKDQQPSPDISEFVAQAESIASNKLSLREAVETDSDLKAAQLIKEAEADWEEPEEEEQAPGLSAEEIPLIDSLVEDEPEYVEEVPEVSVDDIELAQEANLPAEEELPDEEDLGVALETEFASIAEDEREDSEQDTTLVDMTSEEEDEDELIDDEIIEIFIEEAEEVLATIDEYLPAYLEERDNREALTELRRAFHTLKGSGRMVGAKVAGELAWSIENLLNKIIEGSIFMNDDIGDLMQAVVETLPVLVEDFKLQRKPSVSTAVYEKQAAALAKGELVQPLKALMASSGKPTRAEEAQPTPIAKEETPVLEEEDAGLLVDPVLLEIFESETRTHLATLTEFGEQFKKEGEPIALTDEVSRALHTLKGSANTAGIEPIAKIVIPVEKFIKDARATNLLADHGMVELFDEFVILVEAGLTQISSTPQKEIVGTEDFLKDLAALQLEKMADFDELSEARASEKPDPQLINIFLTTGIDILLDAERILEHWKHNPVPGEELEQLVGELKSLANGAEEAQLTHVEDLCRALELAYEHARDESFAKDDYFISTVISGHEALLIQMDKVAAGLATHSDPDLLDRLSAMAPDYEDVVPPMLTPELEEDGSVLEDAVLEEGLDALEESIPTLEMEMVEDEEAEPESLVDPRSYVALDPEMVEIFLEEANDLVDESGEQLQRLSENMGDKAVLGQLQRTLHTLKGGARMAEIAAIGDLAHELESLFERLADGRLYPREELTGLLFACHDRLAGMVESIAATNSCEPANELVKQVAQYIKGEGAPSGSGLVQSEPVEENIELPETEDVEDRVFVPESHFVSTAADDYDPELVEIFLEEAFDIINNTSDLLDSWRQNISELDFIKELQRELHTLKGGARMAELAPIGDLSHEMENVFERLVDGRLTGSEALVQLCLKCHDALSGMVEDVANQQTLTPAVALQDQLKAALAGAYEGSDEPVAEVLPEEITAEEEVDTVLDVPVHEEPRPEAVALAGLESEEAPEEALVDEPDEGEPLEVLDPEMVEIFLEEANELIDSTANSLQDWTNDFGNLDISKSLQRDMHTLKGGARMSGIKAIGDLAHELETLFESIVEGKIKPSEEIKDLMLECHDALAGMVEDISAGKQPKSARALIESILEIDNRGATEAVVAETLKLDQAESDQMERLVSDPDHENLVEMFIDEAEEQIAHIRDRVDAWKSDPDNLQPVIELQKSLDALKGSARLAGIDPVDNLASAMAKAAEQTMEGQANVTEELLKLSGQGVSMLTEMLTKLAAGQPVPRAAELTQALSTLSLSEEREVAASENKSSEEDVEVIEIFLEEANDLLESIDNQMDGWSKDPSNGLFNKEIQRALHTLKGGARLAGIKNLGDASHAFESMLIQSEGENPSFDGGFRESAQKHFDGLNELVESVRESYREIVERGSAAEPETEAPAVAVTKPESKAEAKTVQPVVGRQMAPEKSAGPPQAMQPAARQAQQESVRVNAGLLDELVNLAGETSITRGRLETQISDFSHTLEEMTATIERLKEQLRRMDIETEAQVLFRVEREGTGTGTDYGDDFDPLEMDRYSSIQQLSRALTESASDLMDLKDELAEKSRDAETLLLQQSRINTELQEGLMKTRMIPFSSMVPRLRRIVRQVAGELKKKVEFDVHNAEGEMDRTVLERMVAPLEHMLRNALDHGIEAHEDRLKSGKPETGTIDLSLNREGGDIVLRMKDDGGGIRVDAIRKKAIERGMLDANAQISNHEVLQFIMQAGFSTAQKVTQISGRGVGMDVVASEIKQLGGQITIDSEVGKGTEFTIRLPFTVSVNRALMVNTGEDFYAIPLNTIEGIVRVSSYELEEYYKPGAPLYEYAGKQYKLQYIGSLLQSEHKPKLQGQALPLPVILVRGGEQSMALQVDGLMGSREIVVKSLGTQFSSVRGVSGATILGDGSVVVILDLPALIRADMNIWQQKNKQEEKVAPLSFRPTQVLVVDDSVTVRKVTTRLLQRNGMEVITAKDGVDAVTILQEIKPDVMLLDIEMPRMDGFEVASFVRHDEHLQDVPIIMITSRTGQKHKDRAMSIGVNEYLGKPFQEKSLLSTIEKLVKK